jgi:hypothetical protein
MGAEMSLKDWTVRMGLGLSVALGLGFGLALAASAAEAAPAVTTQWTETTMSQDMCLKQAVVAIRKGGFDDIQETASSRYGTLGQYTAVVCCIADKHLVFFIVAGPSNKETPRYMDQLYGGF